MRERKKHDTHRRIVAECGALFREHGYDETSIDDIAEAAAISRQTFFNYFTGKEAVLAELGLEWLEAQAALPPADPDPFGPVPMLLSAREVVLRQARAIESDRVFMTTVFTRSDLFTPRVDGESSRLRRDGIERAKRIIAGMAGVIRAGQGAGEIRRDLDPVQAAETYVTVMFTTIRMWLSGLSDTGRSLEDRVEAAIDLLERGLRADDTHRTSAAGPMSR